MTEVWSAIELVGTRPVTVQAVDAKGAVVTEGTIDVLAEEGHVEVHAVMIHGDEIDSECSRVTRRLTPTGRRCEDIHPQHLARCPECLSLHSLPD